LNDNKKKRFRLTLKTERKTERKSSDPAQREREEARTKSVNRLKKNKEKSYLQLIIPKAAMIAEEI
jgi:hypothetical protein